MHATTTMVSVPHEASGYPTISPPRSFPGPPRSSLGSSPGPPPGWGSLAGAAGKVPGRLQAGISSAILNVRRPRHPPHTPMYHRVEHVNNYLILFMVTGKWKILGLGSDWWCHRALSRLWMLSQTPTCIPSHGRIPDFLCHMSMSLEETTI